jgi:DNA-binding LytR/AlgR family response regulator
MKLVVGICDDNIIQVDTISNFLEKNVSGYQLQLIKAYSGEELLFKLENIVADVVFLDIEMNGINGLQTGKRIRDRNPQTIIIFVTGYRKFALDAFKIKTMDYLIKPVTEKRLKTLLNDLLIRLNQIKYYEEKNKTICFSFRDNIVKLKYNEIYFFEKNLRKITVFSEKGEFSFYERMDELLNRLDLEQFVHCHNSFLVNKAKILKLKNDSIYIQDLDRTIPVSKKNKLLIREIFEKNIFV